MKIINSRVVAIESEVNNLDLEKREKKYIFTLEIIKARKIEIGELNNAFQLVAYCADEIDFRNVLKENNNRGIERLDNLVEKLEKEKIKFKKICNI